MPKGLKQENQSKDNDLNFHSELVALKRLIDEERKSFLSVGVSKDIINILAAMAKTEKTARLLITNYQLLFNANLIDDLTKLSNNYDNIKTYLSPFIELKIVQATFPHNINKMHAGAHSDIRQSIEELLDHSGFLIISVNEYYVQLMKEIGTNTLLFEAVSHDHVQQLPNKEAEFERLGFIIERGNNYQKVIEIDSGKPEKDISILIDHIKVIFKIYGLELTNYSIEKEFDLKDDLNLEGSRPSEIGKENVNQQKSVKMHGCFITIAVIVLLYTVIMLFSPSDTVVHDIVTNSSLDASVHQVEQFLKDNLNDPDSYEGISWSEVQILSESQEYKYYVRHKYRAKNSFGGYVIENQIFYLDANGNVVDVKDYE